MFLLHILFHLFYKISNKSGENEGVTISYQRGRKDAPNHDRPMTMLRMVPVGALRGFTDYANYPASVVI